MSNMRDRSNRDHNLHRPIIDCTLTYFDIPYGDLLGKEILTDDHGSYRWLKIIRGTKDWEFFLLEDMFTHVLFWVQSCPCGLYVDFCTPTDNFLIKYVLDEGT